MKRNAAGTAAKRGPLSFDDLLVRIDHGLRYLDDRIELNRNPLTRLSRVETLAQARYASCVHPEAVALHEMLDVSVRLVLSEIEGEARLWKVREFLSLYRGGSTIKQAGKQLGMSREYCSRVIKKRAVELVAEKFIQLAMQRHPLPLFESPRISQGRRKTAGVVR